MHRSSPVSRAAAPIAAVLMVAGLSGCHWFGKSNDLYAQSAESRPLEVPPDLDRPSTDRAMVLPSAGGSATAGPVGTPGASSIAPIGFTVAGDRDVLYSKVGEVLAGVEGVTIVNKAQILGTYDVDYMDAKFLVRVTKAGDNVYVSAVDPRGLPPTGEAPVKLIGALKAAIAP